MDTYGVFPLTHHVTTRICPAPDLTWLKFRTWYTKAIRIFSYIICAMIRSNKYDMTQKMWTIMAVILTGISLPHMVESLSTSSSEPSVLSTGKAEKCD